MCIIADSNSQVNFIKCWVATVKCQCPEFMNMEAPIGKCTGDGLGYLPKRFDTQTKSRVAAAPDVLSDLPGHGG
jgi:hypothetical protein